MTKTLIVVPAYGRDYKSMKALMEDWQNGKDFKVYLTGQYVNRFESRNLIVDGYKYIQFRYYKMQRVHLVQLETEKEIER